MSAPPRSSCGWSARTWTSRRVDPRKSGIRSSATASQGPTLAQDERRIDQRQVRERLGEVPKLSVRNGVVLLGEQAQLIAEIQEPFEEFPAPVELTHQG